MRIKSILTAGIAIVMSQTCFGESRNNDVRVDTTGVNQQVVHLKATHDFLILPVQETMEDSEISLIKNGIVVKTFYVRLAKDSIDYTVPFDLRPYKGENLVMLVNASKNSRPVVSPRKGKKRPDKSLWVSNIAQSDTFILNDNEIYRPAYHHTPLYGWMNDPNGMFYKDGKWHLYYQWNPYGSRWQNMTWGHSSSSDLVNWEHHPAAIEPNALGSIFSGSAAIDKSNSAGYGTDAVVALYTSAGDYQTQSLAGSVDDGMTFANFTANPVISLPTEARDPNFFFNEKTGLWNLVLAHALEKEILVFSSPDLKDWTLESHFGKGLGARDGVWECPDLFELTVDGTGEKKWMMIVNINPGGPFGGSATQYFIGDFDGETFTPDKASGGYVPTKWLDFGKDFYATVSWSDAPSDRRTAIAWMSNWQYADQVPTMRFRSANTLPREIGLFKAADGQIYASSVPSPELQQLRERATVNLQNVNISTSPKIINLPHANNGICEIELNLNSNKQHINLILSNQEGEEVVMAYDPASNKFTFNRTESGLTDFSEDFPAITTAPTFDKDGKLQLTIFIDHSSIEVFGNDGKFSMTNLVFPSSPYSKFAISTSDGTARLTSLRVYPLKPTVN